MTVVDPNEDVGVRIIVAVPPESRFSGYWKYMLICPRTSLYATVGESNFEESLWTLCLSTTLSIKKFLSFLFLFPVVFSFLFVLSCIKITCIHAFCDCYGVLYQTLNLQHVFGISLYLIHTFYSAIYRVTAGMQRIHRTKVKQTDKEWAVEQTGEEQ